jgi:adenine phosphoribosyltransferase
MSPSDLSSADLAGRLRRAIRDVADFPKPGILFKDITPVLADAALFREACESMAASFADSAISHVVAIESRGFILGAPVAQMLGAGFVPVRKRGKLPHRTEQVEYALEYGTDVLEIHVDGCAPPGHVLVVDDVLATGGTAAAACALVEKVGATVVGCAFLLELAFLDGATALAGRRHSSVVMF